MIDFNVISTGSKGNAVVINHAILVDCGVSFKALQPYYKNFQLVLLTHEHGDHFNKTTLRRLARERPTLRFGCCEWLVEGLVLSGAEKRNIDVYEPDKTYNYGAFTVEPFPLVHDVPNAGYKINFNGERLLYATDTNSMEHVEAQNYDLYMLEANYTQDDIIERIESKMDSGAYCYEYKVLHNHLSKDKADNWLYQNMGANSQYIYLHGHEERRGA